ncbi:hypothetical protein SAMN04489762_2275 [Terribacillus saccharophilus]|uniref:DUF3221 domain-containing protein n=1 Tax=Terribacillus saccharophilus TaxID=361277 RepID=A0A075LLJ8_9BACI|nr:hypothetical protein GZ22_13840 [Terribacillus goriensis]SEN44804.1 hypothetical protein SAMN04489762_2275 [Terribacillus saccharophilus]
MKKVNLQTLKKINGERSVILNTTRKRLFIIIVTILGSMFIAVLLIFTFIPTHSGVIIEVQSKNDMQDHPSIWVVESSPHDILNKSESELTEMYEHQGTVFDLPSYIPDAIIKDLSPGQEVEIYFNGLVEASAPAGGEAYWITTKNNQGEKE